MKDVHLKFSRIFVVKSCLEKTRLLITVAGCKKYRFFLKKFEVNKQNCRDEMSNFSYLSLFDQSHPGCFSRYVESFIRGVMGFVVRFLACGRSCHHDIIGKVHSRAIPGSWKKRRVFSKGSQDSPPGSLG